MMNIEMEEIQIRVEGIKLAGRAYWPEYEPIMSGRTPLLILCHGIPRGNVSTGEKAKNEEDGGYPALAKIIAAEGFPCFHFNFRGTGESEGNFDLPGWRQDLLAVLEYWEGRNCFQHFFLWGFSAGAAVSCCVASFDLRVKAVALAACPAEFHSLFPFKNLEAIISHFRQTGIIRDSGFPPDPVSWLEGLYSIKPMDYVTRISPRPLLIAHGTADEVVPYEHALKLFARAKEPKKLLPIPAAAHQLRKNHEAVLKCLNWFKELLS